MPGDNEEYMEMQMINPKEVIELSKQEEENNIDRLLRQKDSLFNTNGMTNEQYASMTSRELQVKEPAALKEHKASIRRTVFALKEAHSETIAENENYETAAKEIVGIDVNQEKGNKLCKSIAAKSSKEKKTKDLNARKMELTLQNYVEKKPDIESVKDYSDQKVAECIKSFAKFKYSNLKAYKSDKDFVANYEKIMDEINSRLESGYAVRRYYYENGMTPKMEEASLKAMAKIATLNRMKEYMMLRAQLISNPYYALIDTRILFSLGSEHIEQQMENAKNANPSLAVFLGILLQIKLLGFKNDGTGRRDMEAQILKENEEQWKSDRHLVSDYAQIDKQIRSIRLKIEDYKAQIAVYDGKEAQKQADEQKKQEEERKAELEKEKQKAAAEALLKTKREGWIKKLKEYSDNNKFSIDLEAYKENILLHMVENMLENEHLKSDEDDKFLRIIKLFNERILQKEQQIDSFLEKDEKMRAVTFMLPQRKELVKKQLMNELLKKDMLLKAESAFSLNDVLTDELYEGLRDENIEKHYNRVLRTIPELTADKEVWESILTQKLLELPDEKFEAELSELKAQANTYDKVIKSLIEDAFINRKIHFNLRNNALNAVKKELKARIYFASFSEVVLQTQMLLNSVNFLRIINKTDSKQKRGSFTLEEEGKWRIEKYNNPVQAIRNDLYERLPLLAETFGDEQGELSEAVLNAMKHNDKVLELYPDVSSYENVDAIAELSYRDFNRIMNILCDNVVQLIDAYNMRKDALSTSVRKYAVAQMMSGSLAEDKIQEAIEKGEAQEKEKEWNKTQGKASIKARIFAEGLKDNVIRYNYGRVQGTHLFNQQMFGIDVRQAKFKVSKRFDRLKKAQEIWEEIDAKGLTLEILQKLQGGMAPADVFKGFNGKDCLKELMLCGGGADIFRLGGVGEADIYAYNDKDYAKGMSKYLYMLPRMLVIEDILKKRFEKEGNKRAAAANNMQARKALRELAAGIKPLEGLNDVEVAEARKYNFEKYGVESFEEAIAIYSFTEDTELEKSAIDLETRIILLKSYKNNILEPIMPQLLKQQQVLRKLLASKIDGESGEIEYAKELEGRFAPFLKAVSMALGKTEKKKGSNDKVERQLDFVVNQYINNNFDLIFKSCLESENSVTQWGDAISEYSKNMLSTVIEGRGSIEKLIADAYEYVLIKGKAGGEQILTELLTVNDEAFRLLIEDTKGFRKLFDSVYEEKKNNIVSDGAMPVAVQSEEQKEYHQKLNEAKEKVQDNRALGQELDEDFKKLLELSEATNDNPYVYLTAVNAEKYTKDDAESCLEKVNSALEDMRHQEELPDSLKAFMAEVVFADEHVDIYNELRYMIGIYRVVSEHYKYGQGREKYEDTQEAIERAVVYTYINEKDHTIDESGEMIYKHKRAPRLAENEPQTVNPVAAAVVRVQTDIEKIKEFFGDRYSDEALQEMSKKNKETLLKYIKQTKKQQEKEEKKKAKAEKKEKKKNEKKLKEEEKYENKHKKYLIPKFQFGRTSDSIKVYDELQKENMKLYNQLTEKKVTDPALVAEYQFFIKNIQTSLFSMKPEDFKSLIERRVRYFEYAQKAYNTCDRLFKEHEDNLATADEKFVRTYEQYNKFSIHEYLRTQILKDLKASDAEFDEEKYKTLVTELISNKTLLTALKDNSVSFDDKLGRNQFYAEQKKLSDVNSLLYQSENEDLISEYAGLSMEEKLLFAAALSIDNNAQKDSFDVVKNVNVDGIKKAVADYMTTGKLDIVIDFDMALRNLKDEDKSKPGVVARMFNLKTKPAINEDAFNAAMAIAKSVREAKAELDGPDLQTLGDSRVSYAFAKNHNLRQAYEADNRKCKDTNDFMRHIIELSNNDMTVKGQISAVDAAAQKGHEFKERIDKKELALKLSKLSEDEMSLFVTILQDRTILDYESENREEKFRDGQTIEHVNSDKRAVIKSEYLVNAANRYKLLQSAKSPKALNGALRTLMSFQLRDKVQVDGTMREHFVDSSINRSTVMDWELIKRALDFMNELKEENARITLVHRSNEFIKQSKNQKAIDVYSRYEKEEAKSFGEDKFLSIFESEDVKSEMTEKHKHFLLGYKLLNEQQKALFIKALMNRDILDISKKNSVKSLVLGSERQYVNEAGRYALIDEYVQRSRSGKATVEKPEGMYFEALKSLLSTQIDDDIDFLKTKSKDIKELFVSEKIFSSSRSTAIDWNLFERALQFVTRADNEKDVLYEDAELYRSMGDVSINGDFEFNAAFLRKNIHTTGGRLSRYVAGRIRNKVKQYIPDTGNLRTLLSYVLNVDTMNAVNKSGFLAKEGTTGEINTKYANEYRAERIKKDYNVNKEKYEDAKKVTEDLESVQSQAKEDYEKAQDDYLKAKEDGADEETLNSLKALYDEKKEELKSADKALKKGKSNEEKLKKITEAQEAKIKSFAGKSETEEQEETEAEQEEQEENAEEDTTQTVSEEEAIKKNSGLQEFMEMSELIAELSTNLDISDGNENIQKHIEAIKNANAGIGNLIELMKSDQSIKDKLLTANLDSVMGMAVVLGEDTGNAENLKKVKEIYDSVNAVKEDIRLSFNAIVSDKDVLSKLSEVQIGGILKVVGQYSNIECMDLIKTTAKGAQSLAAKIGRVLNFTKEKDENGEKNKLINLGKDMMDELGVNVVLDVVADYAEYFDKTGNAKEAVISTKSLVDGMGSVIFDHIKMPGVMESAEKRINENKQKKDEFLKSDEYKQMSKKDRDAKINELEDAISTDEKLVAMKDVNERTAIIKSVDLKSMGKIVSSIMNNSTGDEIEKRSAQLNLIKDQIAELYQQYNSNPETKDFVAVMNFDKLLEAAMMEKTGSPVNIAGHMVASSAKLLKNGFMIYLKNVTEDGAKVKFGSETLRKKGETKTKKLNEYGELADRSASDVLNQYGVDEMFEIAKVVTLLDPTGNAPKYVSATQNLKTQVVSMVDKVQTALKEGGYENWKQVTDIDGCLDAVNEMLKLNDNTEKYTNIVNAAKEVNKLKTEVLKIYDTMAEDGDFFEKLSALEVTGIVDITKKFDKNGFVAAMGEKLSQAKEIYNATYGLYTQAQGFYRSLKSMFSPAEYDVVDDKLQKFYENFKNNSVFGDKVEKLYNNGALKGMVQAGMAIKDSVGNLMNIYKSAKGLHVLRKEAYGINAKYQDIEDDRKLLEAQKKQDEMLVGDDFKLSEDEKKLTKKAVERNRFMTGQGVTYARNNEIADIAAEAIKIVGNTSKYTFDPTGISKSILIETAEFVKFITKVFTDNGAMKDYFITGPGLETIKKLQKHHQDNNEEVEMDDLVKEARAVLGITSDIEFRTFIGRNIVTSVLHCASKFNPLEGVKIRARAVLKSIGLDELSGRTDMEAVETLFGKLVGSY